MNICVRGKLRDGKLRLTYTHKLIKTDVGFEVASFLIVIMNKLSSSYTTDWGKHTRRGRGEEFMEGVNCEFHAIALKDEINCSIKATTQTIFKVIVCWEL